MNKRKSWRKSIISLVRGQDDTMDNEEEDDAIEIKKKKEELSYNLKIFYYNKIREAMDLDTLTELDIGKPLPGLLDFLKASGATCDTRMVSVERGIMGKSLEQHIIVYF